MSSIQERESDSREGKPVEDEEYLQHEERLVKCQQIVNDFKDNGEDEKCEFLEELMTLMDRYRSNGSRLQQRVNEMDGIITQLNQQLTEVTATSENISTNLRNSVETNEGLKNELDSAHIREQDYQELIDSLRSQTEFLESEMDKVKKEQDDLATELGISGRTKEAFYKERERLKKENQSLKNDLSTAQTERDDANHDLQTNKTILLQSQQQLDDLKLLNAEVVREKGYMSKDAALQRSLVRQLKNNLILLKTHHDSLRKQLDKANVASEDQKGQMFNLQKMNKELRTAISNDEREISSLNAKIYDITKTTLDNKETIKSKDRDVVNLNKKLTEAERKEKRAQKLVKNLQLKEAKVSEEAKRLKEARQSTFSEMAGMKNQKDTIKQSFTQMNREFLLLSAHLLKTTNLAADYLKKYETEAKVRSTIELERDKLKTDVHRFFMVNLNLSSEKDRCRMENTELCQKLEEELLYIRHKEHLIADLKKEIEEKKMEIRKQLGLYDEMKGERNVIARGLSETQDMNNEYISQNKILGKQLDQLKEQLAMKDSHLTKVERLNKRRANEGVKLKWQLAKSRNLLKSCKDQTVHLEIESNEVLRVLDKTEKDKSSLNKNLTKVTNEKAVILTQLDRKSAELTCLQDNVNFMDIILKKGDRQYNQRLDDIRILRLEVLKLRREKDIITKALENTADLRQEVYHLYADLNKERTKSAALEKDMQTPVNFHRWRFLEGTDPHQKVLQDKVHLLQKRLIKSRDDLANKDYELDELKATHEEFKHKLERIPGIEIFETIASLRIELNKKDEDVKALSSMLACSDFEVNKLRLAYKMSNESLTEIKKKYYTLKSIQDRAKMKMNTNIEIKDCDYIPPDSPKKTKLNEPTCNISSTLVTQVKSCND